MTAISVRPDAATLQALHDGMTLLVLHRGEIELDIEAHHLALREGEVMLYWGAIPRVLLRATDALCTLVEISLETFFGWKLPRPLSAHLSAGTPSFGLLGDIEAMSALKWEDDLASANPYVARAAALEVQACVLRMARRADGARSPGVDASLSRQASHYVLAHLGDDLSTESIARALGRHSSHLMRVFRQETGFTIGAFILRHRLAHAKRLLIESDLTIGEIAFRSGFGSERRFFERFRTVEGCTPGQYRRRRRSSP